MICVSTAKTGLNEVEGSCGMNVIARPRTRSFTTARASQRRSAPLKRTSPPRIRAAPGRMPRMARASVVLPQPLSPTRPTTSPGPISRLMESSTWATPPSVTKSTLSPRTDRSSAIVRAAAPAQPWVEDVAQPITEQVEAHDGKDDGQTRGRRVPPSIGQELARLGDRPAPFGSGRRRSESEESKRRGGEDGEPHADRGAHDDRRGDVGQHVQHGEAPRRGAQCARALHEDLDRKSTRLNSSHLGISY